MSAPVKERALAKQPSSPPPAVLYSPPAVLYSSLGVMRTLQRCRSVDNYKQLNQIEEGTYGVVYRAQCIHTGTIVALKRLKLDREREGFPVTSLREIASLLAVHHPHIVNVREVVVGRQLASVFIVMDFVEHDLRTLMDSNLERSVFSLGEAKELMRQLLSAVAHLHSRWIVHRDLKTSNLLMNNRGIMQVADFGLARRLGLQPERLTPVVVTLWYRAPELLLGATQYTAAIDMWSVGCICAELLIGRPLLPGKTEADQTDRIFRVFGMPQEADWPGVSRLPQHALFHPGKYVRTVSPADTLRDILHRRGGEVSETGIDLLLGCLTLDPAKRLSAAAALTHPFFRESPLPKDPALFPSWPSTKGARERRPVDMHHHQTPEAPRRPADVDVGE